MPQQPPNLIERNARRLLNLVNQILDFRKSQDGGMKLPRAQGAGGGAGPRNCPVVQFRCIRDKSIELELYVLEPIAPAFVDPEVLRRSCSTCCRTPTSSRRITATSPWNSGKRTACSM